jgi:hypothetical protein
MTEYSTLLLDITNWDLVIDSAGNIAVGSPPYSLSQDVASAVRTFLGEVWYDQTQGIPYFTEVLGHLPPASLLTGLIENAAMTVPGVVTAQCVINSFNNRDVSGQILFVDENNQTGTVTF